MLASIVLDQSFPHYTNLDYISGKVYVRTPTSTNVSSIVVKLEGESRTRLMPPPTPHGDRQKPQLEFHKILYKVQAVFPPPEVIKQQGGAGSSSGKTSYTLPAGQHEYPFRFRFPFNNSCDPTSNSNPTISLFGGLNVEMYKAPHRHVKKTLPPTLVGFPGEAEIRYYVKATVNRSSLFKENARAYVPFNFCPIEPPRPPPSDALGYARRRHQFNATYNGSAAPSTSGKSKMAFLSNMGKRSGSTTSTTPPSPVFIAVDMRIPEPAILTCAKPVPLKIVVTSLKGPTTDLSLSSLQIEIVAITQVRAQEIARTERGSTVLFSRSGLNLPIQFRNPEHNAEAGEKAKEGPEAEIDARLWNEVPLPNVVPPSFDTCNISRGYELISRIGVKYEVHGSPPQTTTVDLRLPVQIYSGITPPPELLEALSRAQAQNTASASAAPPMPPRPGSSAAPALPARKPVPTGVTGPPHAEGQQTAQGNQETTPTYVEVGEVPLYGDAPPSYEDALAEGVGTTGELRRTEYAPPTVGEDLLLSSEGGGEKRGWH